MVLESIMAMIEPLIVDYGAVGIFLAMLIETVFPPIPSEAILPLGGYLAYTSGQGLVGLAWMIVAGTLGTTLGAVVIYYIALVGGRRAVLRYGKRFLFDEKKLEITEEWFKKHGDHAIFLCRMAPGLRELISIPAGLSKMNFPKFLLLTFLGSLIWSALLAGIGFFLADLWETLSLGSVFNIVAIVIMVVLVVFFVVRHFLNRRGRLGFAQKLTTF